MKQKQQHETPEFMVIRQIRSNRKFFVASGPTFTNSASSALAATTYATNADATKVWQPLRDLALTRVTRVSAKLFKQIIESYYILEITGVFIVRESVYCDLSIK